MQEFLEFIREKGVLGLAVGIIMGGAITKLVNSIIENLVNPLLSALIGTAGTIQELVYTIPYTQIVLKWGAFVSSLIDFIAILAVIYFVFIKMPILSSLDKKKEE